MKKIIHHVIIHAPLSSVFEALTTGTGLAGWWSTRVQAQTRVGGMIRFQFLEDFNPGMRIEKLEHEQQVLWRCVEGHDNWKDNTFSFLLSETDGETALQFIQIYAQELADDVYGTYNFNWGYYLNSLKLLCETGKGTPFRPQ